MDLWKKITGEFVDVIEWIDDTQNTMVYRFERYGNEIKYGAQLTVRETQMAIFINEGQLADIFTPGRYELTTQNMPIMTTLKSWEHGFNSPFKAEVYFVNTKVFTDRKWGTTNPIMLRDPEFGPVRLRAFGTYTIKIEDAEEFIKQIVGTDGQFNIQEITNQLRNIIVARFTDVIGESKIPILDLAANLDELSKFIHDKISPEFSEYGLSLEQFFIENISLPKEVEEALDKRSSMGIIGDLNKYTQYQTAEAMEKAAENPGGSAGEGIGMGMGFAMANQMANQQQQQGQIQNQGNATPPPLPNQMKIFVAQNGEQTGPFDQAHIQGLIQDGTLQKDTLIWKQGMTEWAAAQTVSDVNALFESVPPPLPE